MSTLKDKFDSYTPQPDPEVWQGISSTLMRRATRRRWLTVSSAVVIGAGTAALLLALNNGSNTVNSIDQNPMVVAENNRVTTSTTAELTTESSYVTSSGKVKPVSTNAKNGTLPSGEVEVIEPPTTADDVDVVNMVSEPFAYADNVVSEPKTVTEPITNPAQAVSTEAKKDDAVVVQEPQRRINPKVPTAELAVWIPNAFSPDDPVEESARLFKVFPNNDANIRSFEIYIYSRGGRLVYHSKDVNQGWDGTANGQPQPMGTYVYIIELNDAVKGLQHKKGTITLIR